MTAALLTHDSHRRRRDRPGVPLVQGLSLEVARAHEFCGNARRTLAMILAGGMDGPVIWIRPAWTSDRLNPEAMTRFVDPGRFLFVTPRRPEDVLWSMEEALRAGIVPLVVADIPAPPALTPVRRLHLAAETGATEGRVRPLALLLTPGDGGAQGVESRWRLQGAHGTAGAGWSLSRLRARSDPPQDWLLTPSGRELRLAPMPQAS